jgi:protein involved in polysaccharide export with SLBB domain
LFEEEIDSLAIKEDPRAKIFGYSLFNTMDLTFEPSINVPTPKNYVLGPGDEINIDIWGASQQNYQLIVSPDGYIIIDMIGPVQVSGMSIEEATGKITARLSSIYAGMRGSNPNTFAQISLGNLRSIKVVLLGEVYLPGSYTLSSLAQAFNALYLSGGPNINGSLRNIQIIRNNKVIDSIDVYDFLFKGDIQKNILLNDQDIIKIDPYSIRVKVSGEVKRPLIYEMKSNETLADLIRFSGGFSEKAYSSRLKVIRNNPREKEILDFASSDFASTPLQNGDSVVVEPILERFTNRVEIKGAVYRPGEYAIQDNLTLLQLIEKAEGLKGDAFLSRAVIYRTRENYTLETIPVDLALLMNGSFEDITLKREDIVNIPSIFDLQEEYYVQIDGEVRKPGQFPFMYNSTVEDIIMQAGGLLESASMARLEVARRVKDAEATTTTNKVAEIFYYQITKDLKLSEAGKKLVLEPFDRIFIRRSPGYEEQISAFIEGEVLFPGEYSISNKDERISDIINRAGGLTHEAYPKGASLIRVFRIGEKERAKAIQSGEMLRRSFMIETNAPGNLQNDYNTANKLLDERKRVVLDSMITAATLYKDEQAIGIDLVKILAQPHSKFDILVQEGDRLIIPKQLQTVSLNGELLHPITARYDDRNKFRDYIRSAGGFTSTASRSKSYVIYANGSVDITRSALGIKNYPRLEPGAEIVVPKKEAVRKLSAGELVSLGSALTSMGLLVVTLLNTLK